jgi:hypothetical protein
MKINQDNYEQYFLDHAEGNLSPEMERELEDFLDANPDLRQVLDGFDPSPLQTEKIHNEILRTRLKKHVQFTDHIGEENVEEWMIREVEGLLDESEVKELQEFLTLNPAFEFDHRIFGLTKLVTDQTIAFPHKKELKKKGALLPVSRLAWTLFAAAAVFLILIGIRFYQKPGIENVLPANNTQNQVVAEIPESVMPVAGTPSAGRRTPSHGTPSEKIACVTRPESFRLKPAESNIINSPIVVRTPEIKLVSCNPSPIITVEKKEKPLIAKVFGNVIARAKNSIDNKTKLDEIQKPDFSFWSIAKVGIEGYNSISDRNLELYVRKNEEGKVKSYALVDQDRLLWSKNLDKP